MGCTDPSSFVPPPPCRCLLCGKKVQHDEGRMRSHLKRKHTGVNLRRYDGIRRRRRK